MARLFTAFLLALLLTTATAQAQECDFAESFGTTLGEPLAALAGELVPVFVGCRPSPGECVQSCPNRQASWEVDPERCDPYGPDPYACSCLVDGDPDPVPPPEGSIFVGCRPSPGECVNSCPTRDAWSQEDPASCPVDGIEGSWACYCR